MKTLKARVEDSFTENDKDQAKQYLDWLQTTLYDLIGIIRRNAILLLILIAAFEFVEESSRASFELGGFHIDKTSSALPIIPALVAYFFFRDCHRPGQV